MKITKIIMKNRIKSVKVKLSDGVTKKFKLKREDVGIIQENFGIVSHINDAGLCITSYNGKETFILLSAPQDIFDKVMIAYKKILNEKIDG